MSALVEWVKHPTLPIECTRCGRVRSSRELYGIRNKNRGKKREYKGSTNQDGYLILCLSFGQEKASISIHRAVAQTFLGTSGLQVNHKDGNKKNNVLSNLEYVTPLENIQHAIKSGLRNNRATNVHNSKFDDVRILVAATYHNAGFGQDLIAKMLGVSRAVIRWLSIGKTYSEYSFLFDVRPPGTHSKYTSRSLNKTGELA